MKDMVRMQQQQEVRMEESEQSEAAARESFARYEQFVLRHIRGYPDINSDGKATCGLGLCGEIQEYLDEIEYPEVSAPGAILKELGDVLWYICALHMAYCPELDFYVAYAIRHQGKPDFSSAGRIADMVKKDLFHSKPLSKVNLRNYLAVLLGEVIWECVRHGWTLRHVWETNQAKLEARHPSGGFTPVYHDAEKEAVPA